MKCSECPFKNSDAVCNGEFANFLCRSNIEKAKKFPNFIKQALNYASSFIKHCVFGFNKVNDEIYQTRLQICQSNKCGRYEQIQGDDRCVQCGCVLNGNEGKARWAEQKCPLTPPLWDIVVPPSALRGKGGCGGCK